MKKGLSVFLSILMFFSCICMGFVGHAVTDEQKENFINSLAAFVQKYATGYEIRVCSPVIAQAVTGSDWGETTLASEYYNYFGLTCGSSWTGRSVNPATGEVFAAGSTGISSYYRVYDSMEQGVKGYFDFLQISRYSNLKGISAPRTYLETILADGFSSDSEFVAKNMAVIEQYSLTKYDALSQRGTFLAQAQSWLGCKESDGSHQKIIDTYNTQSPLPRNYTVKYTDDWCATFVSACAVKTGLTDIVFTECSCGQMVELYKSKGTWQEDESVTPEPGYIILYDWDDSGTGNNTGWPDHVGIVERVKGTTITVIEGNKSEAVSTREIAVNAKFIRGYGIPAFDDSVVTVEVVEKKSDEEIALEVVQGKWGNGTDRKTRLTEAGYDYSAVQAKVNTLVRAINALSAALESARAEAAKTDIYTAESIAALNEKISEAQAMLDGANSVESEVSAMNTALTQSVDGLKEIASTQFTVNFLNYDGTVFETKTVSYGESAELPEGVPVKPDDNVYTYTFSSWSGNYLNVTENTAVTPVFDKRYVSYTVTFKSDTGGVISTAKYHYGEEVVLPSAPEKESDGVYNYTFTGWSPAVETVTKDAVYTARFAAVKCTKILASLTDETQMKILKDGREAADLSGTEFSFEAEPGEYVVIISKKASVKLTVTDISLNEGDSADLSGIIAENALAVGDINGDGIIDIQDLSIILKSENYARNVDFCDLDGDGSVTINDVATILNSRNYGKEDITVSYAELAG